MTVLEVAASLLTGGLAAVLLWRWGVAPAWAGVAAVVVLGLAPLAPSGRAAPVTATGLAVVVVMVRWRALPRERGASAARAAGWTCAAAVVPALLQPAWWPVPFVLAMVTLARVRAAARGPQADELDRETLTSFAAANGSPRLEPVAVVIAAYQEADSLPAVLQAMPREVLGLGVDVVVVDDGSGDGTAEAAEAGRAHVLRCPTNRGQGAALRLGYRFAREHGARYIVTTDADGQYDVADLSRVLHPVVAGEADFATGSRVLGRQETHDRVRRIGVHVFAWTVTVLTGHRITDTSFGLRAMRADLTAVVTLDQPQYQSSELLIGMLAHGARVVEVPATMQTRSAGSTKKGTNLFYGRRYAGVVWGTWWREYAGRAVLQAPAMRGGEHHARAVATR